MSTISVGKAYWGPLALALASCGAPASRTAAASAPPPTKPPAMLGTPDSSDQPPASWGAFVAEERIWRRPDLDRLCDAAHSGFFMPRLSTDAAIPPVPPTELGCAPPAEPAALSERITEAPPDLLGTSYCCPRSRTAPLPHTAGAPSCEQAVLDYIHHFSGAPPSDVSAGSSAAILNRGSYFTHCAVPNSIGIDICAAILEGRAIGVTVRTSPVSPANAECVADSILHLTFPSSSHMDLTRTKF